MTKLLVNKNGNALMSADGKVYSSAGVSIKIQGGWQGTTVANNGEVGNVYVNTNLSVEEVTTLLDNIIFPDGAQEYFLANESGSKMLVSLDVGIMSGGQMQGYVIAYFNENGMNPIFSSTAEDVTATVLGVAFTGWYSDFNGVFEFNDTAIAEISGISLGTQNDKLTNLFSSTPFTRLEGETISLTGEYDGSTISITPSEEELKEYNIELKPYIQEQKIPLNFKIKLQNPLLKLINRTKSCNYLYYQYHYETLSPLISGADTTGVQYFISMYSDCKYVSEFPELDTSNGEYFDDMYSGCRNATTFPLLDTSNGSQFSGMYENCSSATSFPELDTSNGVSFSSMYHSCSSATTFPLLDTSNGSIFSYMYTGCSSATSFPELDTSNGEYFDAMYRGCSSATSFPLLDTINGIDFSYMYRGCSLATSFPEIDTFNGTHFSDMYTGCSSATSFPTLDTRNGKYFTDMYRNCSSATSFPELDTRNGTHFINMYHSCRVSTSFPALDTRNGEFFDNMYKNCSNATSILMYGMKVNFDVSSCSKLEIEALVTILSNCQVITSTQKLTMGSALLAKLEGVYVKETGIEQYEGITCRPCVICESSDTGAMLAIDYFTGKGWTLA